MEDGMPLMSNYCCHQPVTEVVTVKNCQTNNSKLWFKKFHVRKTTSPPAMGKFLSVFTAFVAISMNIQIFRQNQDAGLGPLISTYIFLFAFVLLLWDLTLYPKSLRKLGNITQFFVEFLIADFLTESIMIDFWFPLEKVTMEIPPKSADFIDDMLTSGEWRCENLCDVLRGQAMGYIVSYLVSLSFLLSVLHSTRMIDLRALSEGPGCFFGDISFRFKRFWRKFIRRFGKKNGCGEMIGDMDDNEDDLSDSKTSIPICHLIQKCPNKTRNRRTLRRGKRDIHGKQRKPSVSRERGRKGGLTDCLETTPFYAKLGCNIL